MSKMTREELITKIAKMLIKEFKAKENARYIPIEYSFTYVNGNKHNGYFFDYDKYEFKYGIGDIEDDDFDCFTRNVADEIYKHLKVKKSEIRFRVEKDHSHSRGWGWVNTTMVKGIYVCPVCKEFLAINKKLIAHGLNPVNYKDWWYGGLFGKRGEGSVTNKKFYGEDSQMCQKVLDYLKGKKKFSYEITEWKDDHDRERGIEYETEWYGSIAKQLKFTDYNKKTTYF